MGWLERIDQLFFGASFFLMGHLPLFYDIGVSSLLIGGWYLSTNLVGLITVLRAIGFLESLTHSSRVEHGEHLLLIIVATIITVFALSAPRSPWTVILAFVSGGIALLLTLAGGKQLWQFVDDDVRAGEHT